jgi:hypothetical protein
MRKRSGICRLAFLFLIALTLTGWSDSNLRLTKTSSRPANLWGSSMSHPGVIMANAETGTADFTSYSYLPFIFAANPNTGKTYYISPTGDDNRSGLSVADAWATFTRAWQDLYPGDTLILLDGVYYQSLNPNKRNGEPNNPITIRAQNDGKAVIDGQFQRIPLKLGDTWPGPIGTYFVLEGLVIKNSSRNVIEMMGSHNILRRISAYNASTDGNSFVINVGITAHNNLIEDCVTAGTGRKMILIYGGEFNTIRRCFADWHEWDGRNWHDSWPWGENINIYNADHNIVENSIGYGSVPYRSISIIANCNHCASVGNKVLGSIAVDAGMNHDSTVMVWGDTRPQPTEYSNIRNFNWPGQRSGFQLYGQGELRDNLFEDIFAWGNAGLGLTFLGPAIHPDTQNNHVNRATLVGNGIDNPKGPWPGKFGGIDTDVLDAELAHFTSVTNSYIENIFIDWPNYPNGPRNLTSMAGEGARLTHRYVDGELTNEPLWPWPMEGRIQAELGISVTEIMTELIFGATGSPGATSHSPHFTEVDSSPTTPPATLRRVNVPYVDPPAGQPAIFWFGKVDPTHNYADVRTSYRDDGLRVTVHVIDRMLWYDTSPSLATLTDWDAVTLFLHASNDAGPAPSSDSHRFVAQLNHWQPRPHYQAAFQGNGSGWVQAATPFETRTGWRGNGLNNDQESRGWFARFLIPYSSLGLAGPPPASTTWRMAVVVHDRDDAAGTPIPDTTWPEQINGNNPATWGEMVFGLPAYNPPLALPGEQLTIRQGLNGSTVVDAHVGGHTECGKDHSPNYFASWGDANYAGYSQINVQNQWDIADWPCFSKYFVTFPLDAIPPGETILSSTMTMHKFGTAWGQLIEPSFIQLLVVADDWDENTLTWNNAPLAVENITGTWVEPGSAPHPGIAYSWNVSPAVADAYASGKPLRLALYSADGAYHSGRYFTSSDTGDWNAVARPTLNIVLGNLCASPEVDCLHAYLPLIQQ